MAEVDFAPINFICGGRRMRSDKKLGIALIPADGSSEGRELVWDLKPTNRQLRAGAVYAIEAAVEGPEGERVYRVRFGSAKYVGKAENAAELEALDAAAAGAKALQDREKRETMPRAEMLQVLLPLRQAYEKTNWEGQLALEVLVLQLLRRSPRFE